VLSAFDRLAAKHPAARAVRIWKRDGGRNVMSLAAAACNLAERGLADMTADEAAEVLLTLRPGEYLATKRALFRLERGKGAA
jgi:hypothetical protein